MTFAEKLLALRKGQEMSQEELAAKLEVSRQAVSRWEVGTALPDALNLLRISKLFGVSIDDLLNDDRELPEKSLLAEEEKTVNEAPASVLFHTRTVYICGWISTAVGLVGMFVLVVMWVNYAGPSLTGGTGTNFMDYILYYNDSFIVIFLAFFFMILLGIGAVVTRRKEIK